jgi:hypothetical protein
VKPNDVSGERMSEERPNQSSSDASILLVGLMPDVFARAAAIVAPHGITARATTLAKLAADTAHFKPLVVLVDAYVYDFDSHAFDKLARDVGATLGVVGNAKEAEELLESMLRAPRPTESRPADEAKSAPARTEFVTAKYDVKTLNEALERMGANVSDRVTAKFDAKALCDEIKRLDDV